MKTFLPIACLFAATFATFAAAQSAPPPSTRPALDPDCANATTQARTSQCAYEDFLAATAAYAASYKTLSNKMSEVQKNQFRRTQKLWIQYRTAACELESSGVAGGSVQPRVKAQCDARMTRARTAELTALINCKEGDLSCPRFKK